MYARYRMVMLDPSGVRGRQGFVAKLVTPDFEGEPMDVGYFEDAEEATAVRDALNTYLAESIAKATAKLRRAG